VVLQQQEQQQQEQQRRQQQLAPNIAAVSWLARGLLVSQ